jgi:ketosteroid isomerase-like protein
VAEDERSDVPVALQDDPVARVRQGAYDSFELVPQEWVDGGDTIVMLGRVTVRLEGRESSQSVAQVWKFQDGKIARFESFQDTLATARVLGAVG